VSFNSLLPSATLVAMEPSTFSDWGSPDGKLDWSIRGDELNKMRKSYSFSFQNRSITSTAASNIDDPDVEDQQQRHNPDAVSSLPEKLYIEHKQKVV